MLALPPKVQREMVARCCTYSNLKILFLEKPIAVNPLDAIALVNEIRQSRIRFRVGYTFLYTDWFDRIEIPTTKASDQELVITWRFMAHHFVNEITNWKAKHSEGGGALRFFAIHLLAVLASRGYSNANRSVLSGTIFDCPERWEAAFSGAGLPNARVYVDTRSDTARFGVEVESGKESRSLVDLPDPFPIVQSAGGEDRRVSVLKRLLGSIAASDESHRSLCDHVNMLWLKAEEITEFAYTRGPTAH